MTLLSNIKDKPVVTEAGTELGLVRDVEFEPTTGTISCVLVEAQSEPTSESVANEYEFNDGYYEIPDEDVHSIDNHVVVSNP